MRANVYSFLVAFVILIICQFLIGWAAFIISALAWTICIIAMADKKSKSEDKSGTPLPIQLLAKEDTDNKATTTGHSTVHTNNDVMFVSKDGNYCYQFHEKTMLKIGKSLEADPDTVHFADFSEGSIHSKGLVLTTGQHKNLIFNLSQNIQTTLATSNSISGKEMLDWIFVDQGNDSCFVTKDEFLKLYDHRVRSDPKSLEDLECVLFPGGNKQIESEVEQVCKKLSKPYPRKDIMDVYVFAKAYLYNTRNVDAIDSFKTVAQYKPMFEHLDVLTILGFIDLRFSNDYSNTSRIR